MKVDRMRSIPTSRVDFERNMFILAETMRKGNFHIAAGLNHSIRGILRVRRLPNSRIDLLSIDEAARLQANMIANMEFERLIPSSLNDLGPDETTRSEEQ